MDKRPLLGLYDLPKYEKFEKRFDVYKQAGFTHLALSWWDEAYAKYGETKEAAMIKARSLGLVVDTVHLRFEFCNALWLSGLPWWKYKNYLYRSIRECERYGIKDVVFHYLKNPYPPLNERGFKRYFAFIEYAKKHNVVVCNENLRRNDCLDELMRRCKKEDQNICYDLGHSAAFARDEKGTLAKYTKFHIETVHLHDNDGISDQHLLLGDGKLDVSGDMEILKKHYKGVMYLEISPRNEMYGSDKPSFNFKDYIDRAYKCLVPYIE